MHFGEVKVKTNGNQHSFEIQVHCGELDPKAVRVELYADVNGKPPVRQEMKRGQNLPGAANGYSYSAAVSAGRPATDYTARVIPHYDGAVIPLEDKQILWQR